jgi:serine/threonine protein kinase
MPSVRFCGRCGREVAAPRVLEGKERCPICLSEVRREDPAEVARVRDLENLVRLTRDTLPPDVQAARRLPGRLFGKYVLVEEIGRGGAGVVQKAWDTMLGEYVALKFLRPEDGQAAQKERILELLQEARAALRLRHDHIVPVRDIDHVGSQFYIAMDYVPGESLAAHLRDARVRGHLSPLYEKPAAVLGYLRDVADAVHYAHGFPHPIVHCDLKPGNVLIAGEGRAYVLDFGLARVLGARPRVEQEKVRGTPAYMAPEQIEGPADRIGVWTDVYGLGAILYELLAGRPPFVGEPEEILRRAIRESPRRPLETVRGDRLGGNLSALEEICLRCLAREPRHRFPSARAVADGLREVADLLRQAPPEDVVPPLLLAAQQLFEERQADEPITQVDVDEALRKWEDLKRQGGPASPALADRPHQQFLLDQFRTRLMARLNAERPAFVRFETAGGVLEHVELLKSTAEGIYLFHDEEVRPLAWEALPPAQLATVAEVLRINDPADRLALAILCRRGRRADLAERYAASLEGTPLADVARDILRAPEP